MNDSRYDRLLVMLVLLAPLSMLLLSKWRASLETWYAPVVGDEPASFGQPFEQTAARWLAQREAVEAELILIVQPDCPCTRATLAQLEAARTRATRPEVPLTVIQIDEIPATLLKQIPATPTLLVAQQGTLRYAGPVTSGNFCTTAVSQVLGLSVLQAKGDAAVFNWLERGCYCHPDHPAQLQRATTDTVAVRP